LKIEVIPHNSGDLLPILLGNDGMPIPAANEFILSRRYLSPNTLVRNLREICVLYYWIEIEKFDIQSRIKNLTPFGEAEIKGGLIEFIRLKVNQSTSLNKSTVSPFTFNQRLTTIKQYFIWCFDVFINSIPFSSVKYKQVLENKNRLIHFFNSSFINSPPANKSLSKGLTEKETDFLLSILDPENPEAFGKNVAVRCRNYISNGLMLFHGLRPGELLSLRVEDIQIGAISSVKVERRSPDMNDTRSPRPQIKRNGRVMAIMDPLFAKHIDNYITNWRDVLEEKASIESNYLILSDEGMPLSQSSITQFYQLLRIEYSDDLPKNLTAKSLRHSFSSKMERILRAAGIDEENRRESLAYLRGDSSLSSQDIYIAQEIEEQIRQVMKKYHQNLILDKEIE